jgi:hypothetical protein
LAEIFTLQQCGVIDLQEDSSRASPTGGVDVKAFLSSFLQRRSMIFVMACISSVTCAQVQDAPGHDKNESWTTTTEHSEPNSNQTRTTESHSKSGNRRLDKERVEVLGPDGRYQPYLDTEAETVQENATTAHSIVRTYRTDANGQRNLVQVKDEKTKNLGGEEVKAVRTISNPDLNGNLQVVQVEVADTKKTTPNLQETKTTAYLPNGSGNPDWQVNELQRRSTDGSVDAKKTTMLPDGNGGWQVGEMTESTIREERNNRTSEDRVSRPDSDGKLAQFSRTVVHESQVNGQKTNTVETYSLDLPGLARDGKLHLTQRANSVEKIDSAGSTTEQQVEQPDPGDPNRGVNVMMKTIDVVTSGASGIQETRTTQMRDPSGNFSTVSVDTRKSDHIPAIFVQIAPADTPK